MNLDWPGVETCDGLRFISMFSKWQVCFSTFLLLLFCLFFVKFDIIPLNTGSWLQPPIRVEDKLYQSSTATAASDKSLSDTLMPSNCPTVKTPPCRPTSSQQHCPAVHYCSVGLCFFTPHTRTHTQTHYLSGLLPSCGLQTAKMGPIHCATGVCVFPGCTSLLAFILLFLLFSSVFFRDLIWILDRTWNLLVFFFTIWMEMVHSSDWMQNKSVDHEGLYQCQNFAYHPLDRKSVV